MEEEIKEKRESLKTLNFHKLDKNTHHHLSWKEKLRESCYKRVKEDRTKLLWKLRSPHQQSCAEKEFIESTFQDIVSDELKKLKNQTSSVPDAPKSSSVVDDMLWEYHGVHIVVPEDCEEILLEMQRIFYEDVCLEVNQREAENFVLLVEEEDEYLASAIQEYMHLNDGKGVMVMKTRYSNACGKALKEQTWCPICRKGELQENLCFIYCSLCYLKLNRGEEVNIELLRGRLAEAHEEHLDKGCRSKPDFCVETIFDLTALYLQCQQCDTFEIVI